MGILSGSFLDPVEIIRQFVALMCSNTFILTYNFQEFFSSLVVTIYVLSPALLHSGFRLLYDTNEHVYGHVNIPHKPFMSNEVSQPSIQEIYTIFCGNEIENHLMKCCLKCLSQS